MLVKKASRFVDCTHVAPRSAYLLDNPAVWWHPWTCNRRVAGGCRARCSCPTNGPTDSVNPTGDLRKLLLLVVVALGLLGTAMLYSAGQTDATSAAEGIWVRQLIWLTLASIAGALAYRTSFRLVADGAPRLYGLGLLLLAVLLLASTVRHSVAKSCCPRRGRLGHGLTASWPPSDAALGLLPVARPQYPPG